VNYEKWLIKKLRSNISRTPGGKFIMPISHERFGGHGGELSRRGFLKLGSLAALSCIAPSQVFAAIRDCQPTKRSLSFYNTHTEEIYQAAYWSNGKYLPETLAKMNYILRDHRTGETKSIDTQLLDLLHAVSMKIGIKEPFHIISGYRSPDTNELLRKQSDCVAVRSHHIYGEAVDIRLPGCSLSQLRQVGIRLNCGGVVYYPRADFVHVDVGPVRCW